jgi:hypothetical protein
MHPSVEGFWKFCSLRQEAYWLRQDDKKHPDPAFRYHFCNVYREADRGTLWFHDQVKTQLHGDRFETLSEFIWHSVSYRLLNRLDTFKEFGGLPRREDLKHWLRFLSERMQGGHKIFTGRHLNIGFHKYQTALQYAVDNDLDLTNLVRGSLYLSGVVKALETIPGVGTFFGWQITCDLMEGNRLDRVTDADKWVHLGPGAWNALKLIFPEAKRSESVGLAIELWKTQHLYTYEGDGTDGRGNVEGRYPLVPPPQAPGPMSLKNVEHALCEYARYVRVINTPEGRGVGLEVKKW